MLPFPRPPAPQWRLVLPDSLPAFRRATAAFLDFAASPRNEPISCAPVSATERAAARGGAGGEASKPGALVTASGGSARANGSGGAGLSLGKGWFEAVAAGGGGDSSAAPACGYAWQLAERLYSSAQYALAFQLALAPEAGEEELAELGPEWVRPATLLALQASSAGGAWRAGALAGVCWAGAGLGGRWPSRALVAAPAPAAPPQRGASWSGCRSLRALSVPNPFLPTHAGRRAGCGR